MSKATTTTDPSKEYESANGNPDNFFGNPEVKDEGEVGEEGEESDEYEEINDEVCVQGNITKIWKFNLF